MVAQPHSDNSIETASDGTMRAIERPEFVGWGFTALLIFTQLPGVLAYTIPLPLLAEMAKDLAHDASSAYLVKLVSGGIGPSAAIGSLLGGWLADKLDRRWLTMTFGLLYVLSALAPYLIGDLDIIVATRLCVGLTAGALMTIGVTMVGDYLPEGKRAGTIGMLSALNMVTALVSLPAAGFVGESGWRPAFLLYLAIFPLILLASSRALPPPSKVAEPSGRQWWRLDLPWLLLLLALAIGVILTIPGIYVSFHLATIGLGKTSTVAMIMMGNSLLATVLSATFGKAAARLSWKAIFCVGFSTMGIGLIMFAYAPGITIALPALLLMGAGMGWLAPGIMALAVDSVEEGRRGTVVGAVQSASAVAPLVALSILEPLQVGTREVMLIAGALSLALLLLYTLAPSKRQARG